MPEAELVAHSMIVQEHVSECSFVSSVCLDALFKTREHLLWLMQWLSLEKLAGIAASASAISRCCGRRALGIVDGATSSAAGQTRRCRRARNQQTMQNYGGPRCARKCCWEAMLASPTTLPTP